MGVQNLWKALSKGGAVEVLEGSQPGHHARIVEAVENKVVAVDLSAWLMQAQTQPALLEHYDSPYARAVKVVFDRTIHWLRYGCLPVFVIEGRTPAAKLDKLRARCVAQYGPSSYSYDVGNREGGQFDRLGQAVRRLCDAFGVPCVQAVGEAEAMCAALNVCGWAHAVHTADVDALLFGALTVYRQMHLQTDDPRRSTLTRCCMYDVRRVLGLSAGGDSALMAVAHLAGGDYDMGGADNVGEVLALGAVRQLLAGCQDDESVLQKLSSALSRGPDPELEALTNCTGCKACGHEGGRKNRIKAHSARNGCAACGCADGCTPREWTQCACAFHTRADERLLNRVVKRAAATPGFMTGFRTAAATYADQTRSAIASIQREYGLPAPGSSRNVFSWRSRPDVRAISDIMCGYIKEWDYRQVRLKLLPLLLEWDLRQGPSARTAQVQFRPSRIRKVSSKGAEAAAQTGVPARQQTGWRYVLEVERLTAGSTAQAAAAAGDGDGEGGAGGGTAGGAAVGSSSTYHDAADDVEDLAIDQSWVAGTARVRPPKQIDAPFPSAAAAAAAAGGGFGASQQQQQQQVFDGVDLLLGVDGDSYEGEALLSTQLPAGTQAAAAAAAAGASSSPFAARGFSSSQQQGGGGGGGSGGGSQGGGGGASGGVNNSRLAEHRSVRCSLIDAVWPHLTAAYRQPAASGGRSRSGGAGRKKKGAADDDDTTAAAAGDKQRTVKDFFSVAKDYTAPGRQSSKLPAAQDGGDIPGLAGLTAGGAAPANRHTGVVVAAAATSPAAAAAGGSSTPGKDQPAAAGSGRGAAAAAGGGGGGGGAVVGRPGHQSFMEWLSQEHVGGTHTQQQGGSSSEQPDKQQLQQQSGRAKSAAAAGSVRGGSGRGRKKQAAVKTPCKAGPLDKFLRPAAAAGSSVQQHAGAQDHHHHQQPGAEQQQQQDSRLQSGSPTDLFESPDIPSLAVRLATRKAAAAGAAAVCVGGEPSYKASPRSSRQRPDSPDGEEAAAAAAAGGSGAAWLVPPAKKASTDLAKVLLNSPVRSHTPPAAAAGAAGSSPAAGIGSPAYYSQYQTLLKQMGVASPDQQQQQQQQVTRQSSRAVKGLFVTPAQQQSSGAVARQQAEPDTGCIELLDSPTPLSAAILAARVRTVSRDVEVVDLT